MTTPRHYTSLLTPRAAHRVAITGALPIPLIIFAIILRLIVGE